MIEMIYRTIRYPLILAFTLLAWHPLWAQVPTHAEPQNVPQTLPGTLPLDWPEKDHVSMAERLMDSAHRYVDRRISNAITRRGRYWNYNLSEGSEAYEASIKPNRERFKRLIGVVDERVPVIMERFGDDQNPSLVAGNDTYQVYQVRWPVLQNDGAGVWGEGLLVEPRGEPAGYVVVVPDADQTPEQLMGLAGGIAPASQTARLLADYGFSVIIPMIVDRQYLDVEAMDIPYEVTGRLENSQQTHREWLYRQSYHMGRHIIGYEVQKVLAAVDWFRQLGGPNAKIGVAGYSEGGLIAFHSAAVDTSIDAVLVSGYFNSRENAWAEPIYRNIWALLEQFGDAELATLIAPRGLIVEYSPVPGITGHKGEIHTPAFWSVRDEFDRIEAFVPHDFHPRLLVHGVQGEPIGPGSIKALIEFSGLLGVDEPEFENTTAQDPLRDHRTAFYPAERHFRQVQQIQYHVQKLVQGSERVREQFFSHQIMPELADVTWSVRREHETHPYGQFVESSQWYREYFLEEIIGSFDDDLLPPDPHTRKIYNTSLWAGYDVVLDVFEDLYAWGVLLVPHDIQPGERRPVVVTQHGRNGLPEHLIDGDRDAYNNFAARLADRGFVVFVPHNLYRGEDRYRWLDRKANAVKASLFTFIMHQHDQILRWLNTLDFVDGKRIGFYGLSYGGQTAVRVPAILEGYALSISSGDFNQWTRKVAATHLPFSFMHTIEWEMPYFNLGHTYDYAEMAYLIFPRPFMVERGHHDHVAQDRWVAHEYAKVRRLYAMLGMADHTGIEYFHGGHSIHGEVTFDFLHKHLDWPAPEKSH